MARCGEACPQEAKLLLRLQLPLGGLLLLIMPCRFCP